MHVNFRIRMALMPHESGTKYYNVAEVIVTRGSKTAGGVETLAHRAYTHWGKNGLLGRVQDIAVGEFTKTVNTKAGRGYQFSGVTETNHIRCGIAHAVVSANVPSGLRKHMADDLARYLKPNIGDDDAESDDDEIPVARSVPKKADPSEIMPEWGSW